MTAQIPEKIINRYDNVDFGDYELFSVFIGDATNYKKRKPYPFKQKGDPNKCVACSACWRGYVSVYELQPSGQLKLIRFEYPGFLRSTEIDNSNHVPEPWIEFDRTPKEADEAVEILKGDFWLELRSGFYGEEMVVPFVKGKIVTDTNRWHKASLK